MLRAFCWQGVTNPLRHPPTNIDKVLPYEEFLDLNVLKCHMNTVCWIHGLYLSQIEAKYWTAFQGTALD